MQVRMQGLGVKLPGFGSSLDKVLSFLIWRFLFSKRTFTSQVA